ncbi:MAG: hypothetical protein QM696_02880 [Steroidobacteraceae bacterium]
MPSDENFDRLYGATRSFTRDAPIKERLLEAWSHVAELDVESLPQEMRADYAQMQLAFQSVRPLRGETAVRASVRKMSCADAERHAAFIADLFAELARSRALGNAPRRAPARMAVGSPVVELFAAEG